MSERYNVSIEGVYCDYPDVSNPEHFAGAENYTLSPEMTQCVSTVGNTRDLQVTAMTRIRFIFSIVIAFTVLLCVALLVYGLIEAQFSIGFPLRIADIVVPFCFLGFLILLFMLYQIFSRSPGSRAFSLLRAGALIGLLLFLPQSYLIARGLSGFMHSGIFGFVMYNVVEAAFGRFLLMLIHGQSMYPSDRKRLEYHS